MRATNGEENLIRVVLFREGVWLVAQCLDVDIAAQAKTEKDVLYQLSRLLFGRIVACAERGMDPFETLPPAPKRYWDMYSRATSQPEKILPSAPLMDATTAHSMPTLELKAAA